MKALPLIALAWRKKIVFFIDSVISGAAVGAGFCMVENLLYLFDGESMGIGTALFRGLEVALLHMGCSAIIAAGLMFAVRIVERRHSRLEVGGAARRCLRLDDPACWCGRGITTSA